jgi:CHASE3 domain sensor protein
MSDFFKMNLFFVIATIGFVVLALLLCIALWYVIQILRTINRVADSVEEEAQILKKDFDTARASIKRQGTGFLSSLLALAGFAGTTGKRLIKKKRSS